MVGLDLLCKVSSLGVLQCPSKRGFGLSDRFLSIISHIEHKEK